MAKTPEDLIRREVLDLHAYHVPVSDGMVKLDAMENPYRLPPEMRTELGSVLAEAEINRYPDPTGRHLRNLLAEKMGIPEGMEVLLGNGSDDLIQMLTIALAKHGSAVMYPDPTFV